MLSCAAQLLLTSLPPPQAEIKELKAQLPKAGEDGKVGPRDS